MARALACVLAIAACSVKPIDYADKPCPCPTGLTCDSTTMTCQVDAAGSDAGADAACNACATSDGGTGTSISVAGACYCIDATEVTQGQYAAFLAAGLAPATLPECSWKASNVPSGTWPPPQGTLDLPVANVDWCDASAFCAWAGERLCGAVGGGSVPMASPIDPITNQWVRACSQAGARVYPYGNTYDATTCWDAQPMTGSVAAVASNPGCEGGYPGLFDMSGNVNEWIDTCAAASGALDMCGDLGGGKYYTAATDLECTSLELRPRDDRHSDLGFRCCGP